MLLIDQNPYPHNTHPNIDLVEKKMDQNSSYQTPRLAPDLIFWTISQKDFFKSFCLIMRS